MILETRVITAATLQSFKQSLRVKMLSNLGSKPASCTAPSDFRLDAIVKECVSRSGICFKISHKKLPSQQRAECPQIFTNSNTCNRCFGEIFATRTPTFQKS